MEIGYLAIVCLIVGIYSVTHTYKAPPINLEPGKTYTFHTDGTYEVKITTETK